MTVDVSVAATISLTPGTRTHSVGLRRAQLVTSSRESGRRDASRRAAISTAGRSGLGMGLGSHPWR